MPEAARADVGQNCEENETRKQRPSVGCPVDEADERSNGSGDEDQKDKGVVEPAERFRVHEARLHRYSRGEVRQEQSRRHIEKEGQTRHSSAQP